MAGRLRPGSLEVDANRDFTTLSGKFLLSRMILLNPRRKHWQVFEIV
jgi:hypothetical protein